jgi:hypothetical protein
VVDFLQHIQLLLHQVQVHRVIFDQTLRNYLDGALEVKDSVSREFDLAESPRPQLPVDYVFFIYGGGNPYHLLVLRLKKSDLVVLLLGCERFLFCESHCHWSLNALAWLAAASKVTHDLFNIRKRDPRARFNL